MSLYLPGGGPVSGGGTDPTISSSLGDDLARTTDYAPTLTHDGASVATTVIDTSDGSDITGTVCTGAATTTPTITAPGVGEVYRVTHTTTSAGGLEASISRVVGQAGAGGYAYDTLFDSTALSDYDFLTTGGTGGSGGEGSHDIGASGGNATLDYLGTSGPASTLAISSGVIVHDCDRDSTGDEAILLIPIGNASTDTILVSMTILFDADVPGSAMLFALDDGTTTILRTGAVQLQFSSATAANWRFWNGASSDDFTARTITAASGQSVTTRVWSMGGAATVELASGSTIADPDTAADASRETDTRSASNDTRDTLKLRMAVPCKYKLKVWRLTT